LPLQRGDRYDPDTMSLSPDEREHVIRIAVDVLRHKKRERLLEILRDRLEREDYPDTREQSLDEIAYALARAVDERLDGPDR